MIRSSTPESAPQPSEPDEPVDDPWSPDQVDQVAGWRRWLKPRFWSRPVESYVDTTDEYASEYDIPDVTL